MFLARSFILLAVVSMVCSSAVFAEEPSHAVVGWASVAPGTSGGHGGPTKRVNTEADLTQALKTAGPKVIEISGPIKVGEAVRLTSDTTILGNGQNAGLTGGGFQLRKVQNVILRNLTITGGSDAINIEESHHIWVDHCDLSQCRDGLLDIKRGSDFVTVSWNHFHDHHKTCLLGHSDKDNIRAMDRGHLRVTYHHNFFDGTKTRHPRVRFAEGVHVFNNYFLKNEYGVASVMDAAVIVEGNVFEEVEEPTLTAYGDSPDPGRLLARNNLLINSGEPKTRGEVDLKLLTYSYKLDPPDGLATVIKSQAGIR